MTAEIIQFVPGVKYPSEQHRAFYEKVRKQIAANEHQSAGYSESAAPTAPITGKDGGAND